MAVRGGDGRERRGREGREDVNGPGVRPNTFCFFEVLMITRVRRLTPGQIRHFYTGSRDSLLVTAPDSGSKGCEFESRQERQENFLLQSQLFMLTYSASVPPRVTAVARKRPRSF